MNTSYLYKSVVLLLFAISTSAGILTTTLRIPLANLLLLLLMTSLAIVGFYATTEEEWRKRSRQRKVSRVILVLLAPIAIGNVALMLDLPFPSVVYSQDYVVATLLLVIAVSVAATFWPVKKARSHN